MDRRTPVFIPLRDRVTPLRDLVDWLEEVGHFKIYLIDNSSTYRPLLDYLASSPHTVLRMNQNLGHRVPWLSGAVQRFAYKRHFVVSDPDIVPDSNCPGNAISYFKRLLNRYPDVDKVGFGLRIDDLPDHNPLKKDVLRWEGRFWTDEVEENVFQGGIDTTFALYRPHIGPVGDRALRTGAPYVARHTPWYLDPDNLSEEDHYYREHADPTISNWDRNELPHWKAHWLGIFEQADAQNTP